MQRNLHFRAENKVARVFDRRRDNQKYQYRRGTRGLSVYAAVVDFESHQGAYGVVVNAPIDPWVISEIKKRIELPVVATIISEKQDIDERIRAGADILNIAASRLTPRVVAHIRADYPEIPIIATGGPTDDSIRETIAAGANAITYTPPPSGTIFSESMTKYRDKYAKHDETNQNE